MATAVTPSEGVTTQGQIDKAVANFRAMLEKHAPQFKSAPVQTVLGQTDFVEECFVNFRKRVEAISDLVSRIVRVDRSQKPRQILDDTGRNVYCDDAVEKAMPKGEGEEVEVVFFNLGRWISDDDLEREYELRGLKPCDPYSLTAVNQADPAFADECPNGTHWKDSKGNWCFAAFGRWYGERRVDVNRYDGSDWDGSWWFAGLRK